MYCNINVPVMHFFILFYLLLLFTRGRWQRRAQLRKMSNTYVHLGLAGMLVNILAILGWSFKQLKKISRVNCRLVWLVTDPPHACGSGVSPSPVLLISTPPPCRPLSRPAGGEEDDFGATQIIVTRWQWRCT